MGIRQEVVKNNQVPLLKRYEILERVNNTKRLKDKALISFLYLTGCRIEEVVKFIQEKRNNRVIINRETKQRENKPIIYRTLKGDPIQKKQIEITDSYIIIHNVRTLKRRQDSLLLRSIPILRSEREKTFIDIVLKYIEPLEENDYLFNMTRQSAYKKLKKVVLFPHWLRHIRLSHLAIDYNFTHAELRQFTNWSSGAMADKYIHLNVTNLLNKMDVNK